ncbi:unnamed protein product [Rhizoctonia solani]|uniref:Uncharacterized protein n=2 Tax=Rhizoctonia solani TaxID=456999 RepID=A0A8H2WTC1_9AGAM|nr:unnamed protein product [Rhizoctonia solani]
MAKYSSPALQALSSPRRYIPLAIFTLIIGHYFLTTIYQGYGEATSISRLAESWRKVAETTCNSTIFLPPKSPTSSDEVYHVQPSNTSSSPGPVTVTETPTPPVRRANAVLVFLSRNSDLAGVMQSMKYMEDRFNKKFNYPYVFLNDVPFNKRFKYHTSLLTNANVSYGLIESSHWNQPDWIDEAKATAGRQWLHDKNVIYADSVPYRNMCRFNSGFFFRHELLKQYDYYWRIEPDVTFFCDLNEDPFLFMQDNKKVYGFTISLYEFSETIRTLWSATREFIELYPEYVPEDNAMAFLSDDGGETYNNCHFWSNFEIGDLNFWRSEAYMKYFEFLDSKGGFYYEFRNMASVIETVKEIIPGVGQSNPEKEEANKPDESPLSPRTAQAKLKLEKSIKERPDKQDLVDRNILKDSKVAPALQAAQDKLQRAQLEDKLGKALEGRPKPEELVDHGILNKDEVPPSH